MARGGLAFAALALATGICGMLFWPGLLASLEETCSPISDRLSSQLRLSALAYIIVNVAAGIELYFAGRGRISGKAFSALLALTVFLDLFLANALTMPRGPSDIFKHRPEAAAVIGEIDDVRPGRFRIFRDNMAWNDTNRERGHDNKLVRRRIWEWDTLKRNLDVMAGFEDFTSYGSYELSDAPWEESGVFTVPILALYNVRYIISNSSESAGSDPLTELVANDRANDYSIRRVKDPWPRAYMAGSFRTAPDPRETLRLMNRSDLRTTVILTTDEFISPGPKAPRCFENACVARYTADEIVVNTDCEDEAWLVLNDRYYPGWTASVSGKPALVYKANLACRAVRVPPGKNEVIFSYKPKLLRYGATITLVSLAFVVVILLAPKAGRDSAPADSPNQ